VGGVGGVHHVQRHEQLLQQLPDPLPLLFGLTQLPPPAAGAQDLEAPAIGGLAALLPSVGPALAGLGLSLQR
jgi:hypothetical protein